jgi:hypothetical protein
VAAIRRYKSACGGINSLSRNNISVEERTPGYIYDDPDDFSCNHDYRSYGLEF